MGAGDSKLLFKQAFTALSTEPVTLRSKRLSDITWIFTHHSPENVEKLVAWISLEDLRRVRDVFPRNFAILILMLVENLETFIADSKKTEPAEGTIGNEQDKLQPLLGESAQQLPKLSPRDREAVVHLLRVLTRCLPLLLEVTLEADHFEPNWIHGLLWAGKLPPYHVGTVEKGAPSVEEAIPANQELEGSPLEAPLQGEGETESEKGEGEGEAGTVEESGALLGGNEYTHRETATGAAKAEAGEVEEGSTSESYDWKPDLASKAVQSSVGAANAPSDSQQLEISQSSGDTGLALDLNFGTLSALLAQVDTRDPLENGGQTRAALDPAADVRSAEQRMPESTLTHSGMHSLNQAQLGQRVSARDPEIVPEASGQGSAEAENGSGTATVAEQVTGPSPAEKASAEVRTSRPEMTWLQALLWTGQVSPYRAEKAEEVGPSAQASSPAKQELEGPLAETAPQGSQESEPEKAKGEGEGEAVAVAEAEAVEGSLLGAEGSTLQKEAETGMTKTEAGGVPEESTSGDKQPGVGHSQSSGERDLAKDPSFGRISALLAEEDASDPSENGGQTRAASDPVADERLAEQPLAESTLTRSGLPSLNHAQLAGRPPQDTEKVSVRDSEVLSEASGQGSDDGGGTTAVSDQATGPSSVGGESIELEGTRGRRSKRSGSVSLAELLAEEEAACQELGKRIVNLLLDLLFIRGATLPETAVSSIWLPTTALNGASKQAIDKMRMEVLNAFLVLCSEPLLVPASHYLTTEKPFLKEIAQRSAVHAHRANLLYSLLNMVVMYWPGGNILSHSKDVSSHVVDLACHVLLALLHYKPCLAGTREAEGGGVEEDVNLYQQLLASIEETADFELIFTGLTRLLTHVIEGPGTPFLQTERQVDCYEELLLLTWKLLEGNRGFLDYVTKSPHGLKLLDLLFASIYHLRLEATTIGALHVAFFSLLLLTSQRSCAVSLNKPTTASAHPTLELGRSFRGCYGDVLIHVIFKVIFNGGPTIVPLYACLLTIIANVTPYIKSLSVTSADHLVSLIQYFTSPKLFFANDHNYIYTKYLLESINNLLQYQAVGNEALLFCICRKADMFRALLALDLPSSSTPVDKETTPRSEASKDNSLPPPAEPAEQAPTANGNSSTEQLLGGTETGHGVEAVPEQNGFSNGKVQHPEPPMGGEEGDEPAAPGAFQVAVSETDLVAARASPAIGKSQQVQPARQAEASMDESQEEAPPSAQDGENSQRHASRAPVESKAWLTPGWLQRVRSALPLATVESVLRHLVPQVEALYRKNRHMTAGQLLQYLRETTLVGLLPLPHPITLRRYQQNDYTDLWFTTYLYGLIFLRQKDMSSLPLVDGHAVKLFGVTFSDSAR